MSDDEKLAKLLDDQFTQQGSVRNPFAPFAAGADLNHLSLDGIFNLIEVAEEVHAAGWRPPAQVITDRAVLDALPAGSVILAAGQAWQSIRTPAGPLWLLAGGVSDRSSLYVLTVFGPAIVLHAPTEIGDSNG